MLTAPAAQAQILSAISPLSPERVAIVDAVERVLAEPVVAARDLPAWHNSAMDGYAVRAEDVAEERRPLPVVMDIPAGSSADVALDPGTAARIFTGAPLPPGADTVMIQENAVREGDTVSFVRAASLGENVRHRGEDVSGGTTVLEPGRVLSVGDINLLATLGRSFVSVHRRPRVAIISTGDELVDVDGPAPGRGQIVNSNVYALAAAVRSAGGEPVVLPTVRDDYDATKRAFVEGTAGDVLITCGGMSVGDYDFVRDVLRELTGDTFGFWKVGIKPGKPLGFGHIDRCAVFGLPGNPASTWVTFELFVRPALLRLAGHRAVIPRPRVARVRGTIRPGRGRQNYLRVQASYDADGQLWVDASRNQSSGALTGIANADALAIVNVDDPAREPGDEIPVLILNPAVDRAAPNEHVDTSEVADGPC